MKFVIALATGTMLAAFPITYAAELNEEGNAVIVTATRTAQTIDESLASVTVITRQQIENSQANSLSELLRMVPGINITNDGGYGKNTDLYLRGTKSDQTLVLIDGIKTKSATLGTIAWQDIPIEHIERIEVVRGPRSSLYGSEAMGGVIQIFTRKGKGKAHSYSEISAGSYRTGKMSAGTSGGSGKTNSHNNWHSLRISRFRTEGIDATDDTVTNERDKDGYVNTAVSARFGQGLGRWLEAEIFSTRTNGTNEYDSSSPYNNEVDTVQQITGGKLRLAPTTSWDITVLGGQNRDESLNFRREAGTAISRFDTLRNTYSVQNDITLGQAHIITLGADYQQEEISSTSSFNDDNRRSHGSYGQYQTNFGPTSLLLALREEDSDDFGDYTTGSFGSGIKFDKFHIKASYGTAFKQPTFNDLYYPLDVSGYVGNPNLLPEKSESYELTFGGKHNNWHWDITGYHTVIKDLIDWPDWPATGAPINIGKARINGQEARLAIQINKLTVTTALNHTDAINAETKKELERRSPLVYQLDIDYKTSNYSIGIGVLAESRRYSDTENTIESPGYAIVDLRNQYRLSKHWTLRAKIGNLLDKNYQTNPGYNTLGRNGLLSLAYED